MKNPLKILSFLIIPSLMVQTSCTDAEIDDPYIFLTPVCKLSGNVVAQDFNSTISIDVVFRDFQAARTSLNDNNADRLANTYPGFQEFDYSKSAANKQCGSGSIATKGMVRSTLEYTQCNSGECARPMPASGACYGENLHMWYTDGPHTKTIQDAIVLSRQSDGLYQIKCNATTPCNGANGFFPLDKYSDESTYGKQGQTHNYGFTMAGSAEFKYDESKADVIEFLGDDDMWIFIDGELAIDLGGVHQSVSETFNIQSYGIEKGWENGSMHVINFFYAERQTTESNLTLKIPISDLTPPQFGAPSIMKAETYIGESGKATTLLYIDKQIDMSVIENYIEGGISYGFPIVAWTNVPNGPIYGYRLEDLRYTGKRDDVGYIYEMVGEVCKDTYCMETQGLAPSDSLSFNVKEGDFAGYPFYYAGFALDSDDKYIRNAFGNARATNLSWGENAIVHVKCL